MWLKQLSSEVDEEREITDASIIVRSALDWVTFLRQKVNGSCFESFGGTGLIAGCYLAQTLEADLRELGPGGGGGSRTQEGDFILLMAALTAISLIIIKDG